MDIEGRFAGNGGVDLFERRWEPEGEADTHVVLIHGFGEHCSRYAYVGKTFNAAGFALHTYDQRGFGRSPGRRAYIHDFDVLLSDLDAFLEHVRPRFAGRPWFMMGHSMGGMVLACYASARSLNMRGLVFSSPFLGFNDDVSPLLLALADVLGRVAPWLPVGGVDNSGLSRDPEAVAAADNDPLCFHGRVCARTGAQFNAAIRRALGRCKKITAPTLVLHGADDRIVPPRGSRDLFEALGSKEKEYRMYSGGYHELWNDIVRDRVLADIVAWMEKAAK